MIPATSFSGRKVALFGLGESGLATVRALILLRLGPNRVPSAADIEIARVNFERLVPATAQRVMNFWKARQSA